MNLPRVLLLASLTTFGALAASASDSPSEPVVEQDLQRIISSVEKKYTSVDTIQANFTQKKRDTFGDMEQDGDVVLQRPTRMRWRFTTGDESEFITDGKTLWIYTKADKQVLRMRDTSQATSTANSFLTSLDSLDEQFKITLIGTDGGPELDLVPREAGMYKRIRLALDEDLVLRGVVFTDAYDNVTDITFRDVKLNSKVDTSIFSFEVPDGVKVIDN